MPQTNPNTLLLHLLRLPGDENALHPSSDIPPEVWQTLLVEARRHGVAPLVYRQLKNGPYNPPAETLEALHQTCLFTAARNLLLYHELTTVLPLLSQQGTPVIALKGLHLIELIYQDISLRPMSDMDLLVPLAHLQTSYDILQGAGYKAPDFTNVRRELKRHHHLAPLFKANSAIIELHWNLISPNSHQNIDLGSLWQRAQPANLAGVDTQVLCPEDLLLHLALHFNNHNFRLKLRHLYDLVAALGHYQAQLDWDSLKTRSRQWGAGRSLFLALYLAKDLLNAPLPSGLLDELQPPGFTAHMAEQARQRLTHPAVDELHPDLVQLWGGQPVPQKLKLAWRALFPPLDYMREKYRIAIGQAAPSALRIYPYYLLRLGQLLRRYGGQVWRLMHPDPRLNAAVHSENELTNWLREP